MSILLAKEMLLSVFLPASKLVLLIESITKLLVINVFPTAFLVNYKFNPERC